MDHLEELRKKILAVLLPWGVRRVAIFGSFAQGEQTADSDLDLLVELKPSHMRPPLGLKWFALEEELRHLLGREVELVSEDALSPYVRPYVEKEMIVLYEER